MLQTAAYRSIDLFAGIGGIRLGFEKAFRGALHTVFVSEWDVHAQKTYSLNFKDPFPIAGDITGVDEEDVPAFDICLAGFPCQAFSYAGKKMGFEDDYKGRCRGTLFLDVVRICERHKPAVIFCENVKGLISHDKGRTFETIKSAFEEIGYVVHWSILNSKDFGVPQNRERVYLVCFRSDIDSTGFSFPFPRKLDLTIRDILDPAPIPARYYVSEVGMDWLRRHKAEHEAKGHGFGYVIRPLDGIAGAVLCGGSGREVNMLVDHREHSMVPTTNVKGPVNKDDIRKMTPREWARLQGFPDEFRLELADCHLYKQLGNSVTVPVVEAIAGEVLRLLQAREVPPVCLNK